MATARRRPTRWRLHLVVVALGGLLIWTLSPAVQADAATAQIVPPTAPAPPQLPGSPSATTTTVPDGKVSIDLDVSNLTKDADPTKSGEDRKPSKAIVILLLLTLLSVAPSLVIILTSFTRMVVVLTIARNAVGLQSIPPNQVITGLALFLSLFVMAPTLKAMNDQGLQPYLKGNITQSQALKATEKPLKKFMLANTRKEELKLMVDASGSAKPKKAEDLSLTTVIPAFVLSELKSAFIIGVMVLLPFLIIDLVVSAGLMSLGMMMLPPVFVSLPFKLLLFVMVDGWALIAHALLANYH